LFEYLLPSPFSPLTGELEGSGGEGEVYYFVEKLYPFPEVFLEEDFEDFFEVVLVVVVVAEPFPVA